VDAPRGVDESEAVRLGGNEEAGRQLREAARLLLLLWPKSLAPVAVHQNVSAVAMNIVVRYPVLVRLRRHLPASGVPLIRVAVPTMIPVNPHVIPAGRRPAMLDNSDWRTKTNDNIGSRGAESQRTGKNNSNQPFMKHSFPFLVNIPHAAPEFLKMAAYFSSSPWHSGCWHWQVSSISLFASSHDSLQ
jgi:hypothetical protein